MEPTPEYQADTLKSHTPRHIPARCLNSKTTSKRDAAASNQNKTNVLKGSLEEGLYLC